MGKATIVSVGLGGLYTVRIALDRTRITARLVKIDAELAELSVVTEAARLTDLNAAKTELSSALSALDAQIAGLAEGVATDADVKAAQDAALEKRKALDRAQAAYDAIRLRRVSLTKEQEYLQNYMPADPEVAAWCADLTTDLSGDVGTIEIPGERNGVPVLIHPGYNGAAAYDAARDGQLQPAVASVPAGVFWNWSMLPGWQKWKPAYRLGTITSLTDDRCNVDLDSALSSAQLLSVNQTSTLVDVPIVYMDCHGSAFTVGDRVVVEFQNQDWQQPRVVGFETEPRACDGWLVCKPVSSDYPGGIDSGRPVLLRYNTSAAAWAVEFFADYNARYGGTEPVYGTVDWRSGGTVVSWMGTRIPLTMMDTPRSGVLGQLGSWVARDGAKIYEQTLDVLGAGIQFVGGDEFLLVIVDSGSTSRNIEIRVKRLPGNNSDWDAVSNPDGVKTIAVFDPTEGVSGLTLHNYKWSFNGSCSEAQAVVNADDHLTPFRGKITITGTGYDATATYETIRADSVSTETVTDIGFSNGELVSDMNQTFIREEVHRFPVCVDYVGDVEVVGYQKIEVVYKVIKTHDVTKDEVRTNLPMTGCGGDAHYSDVWNDTSSSFSQLASYTRHSFEVGEFSWVLREQSSYDERTRSSFFDLDSVSCESGLYCRTEDGSYRNIDTQADISQTRRDIDKYSRVWEIDLRAGILVVEEDDRLDQFTAAAHEGYASSENLCIYGTYKPDGNPSVLDALSADDPTGLYSGPVLVVETYTESGSDIRTRRLRFFAQLTEIASREYEVLDHGTYDTPYGTYVPRNFLVAAMDSNSVTETTPTELPDPYTVRPDWSTGRLGACGVASRDGRLFMSALSEYLDNSANAVTLNYLSDGDPAVLTGLTGSLQRYYPVSII